MTWGLVFRLRQSLKGSLWVVPMIGAILGVVMSRVALDLEGQVDVPSSFQYSESTAQDILVTVVTATIGLIGFVVTVSVLVVQMATGTFSARYMRIWYRDGILKLTLAVLVGAFSMSFLLLRHIGNSVPNLGVSAVGVLLGVGVVLFLVFLDRFVHRLRPVAVASLVSNAGRRALRDSVESDWVPGTVETDAEVAAVLAGDVAFAVRTNRSGAVQAINAAGLVQWAERNDCTLHVRYAAGDFVPRGTRIVEVLGEVRESEGAARDLRDKVALGIERTIDQDPAFALRILVDVAVRALSPSVNDPTTAVQVIDHLEDTLAMIGTTPGLTGRWELRDAGGKLRVVMPSHRWDDFLLLGVTEIREYGANSIQVQRRLRAALVELRSTVLPEHVASVERELERLEASVVERWQVDLDVDRARTSDRQGIGGPPGLGDRVDEDAGGASRPDA